MTVREALQYGRKILNNSPSPALDTDVFLQYLLGCDKTYLLLHSNDNLNDEIFKQLDEMLQKRQTGLPVAYITGHKEFYGIDFFVNQDVLIPKPDTEILVEETLNVLADKVPLPNILTVCDMCTGSGCVGLSVLKNCIEEELFSLEKMPSFFLADISRKALDVAKKNIEHLNLNKYAHIVHSNLFDNTPKEFDVITANPPYVPLKETMELLKDGRNEPVLALNGDVDTNTGDFSQSTDGLEVMRNLVPQAVEHLRTGGVLLVEAGEYNALKTEEIFKKNGLHDTRIIPDLEGQLRVITGIL